MRLVPQEEAWAGEFGNEYHKRSPGNVESNIEFFRRIFGNLNWPIHSIIELGAGTGANIQALRRRFPMAQITAVELNQAAALVIARDQPVEVIQTSILNNFSLRQWDLVLTKGVLIHIPPDQLRNAYETIYRAASKQVLMAEYYSPKPVACEYRNTMGLMWKRDFAGEFLDAYPEFQLIDYGFAYHRDPKCPQDDLTWFLMERT